MRIYGLGVAIVIVAAALGVNSANAPSTSQANGGTLAELEPRVFVAGVTKDPNETGVLVRVGCTEGWRYQRDDLAAIGSGPPDPVRVDYAWSLGQYYGELPQQIEVVIEVDGVVASRETVPVGNDGEFFDFVDDLGLWVPDRPAETTAIAKWSFMAPPRPPLVPALTPTDGVDEIGWEPCIAPRYGVEYMVFDVIAKVEPGIDPVNCPGYEARLRVGLDPDGSVTFDQYGTGQRNQGFFNPTGRNTWELGLYNQEDPEAYHLAFDSSKMEMSGTTWFGQCVNVADFNMDGVEDIVLTSPGSQREASGEEWVYYQPR